MVTIVVALKVTFKDITGHNWQHLVTNGDILTDVPALLERPGLLPVHALLLVLALLLAAHLGRYGVAQSLYLLLQPETTWSQPGTISGHNSVQSVTKSGHNFQLQLIWSQLTT